MKDPGDITLDGWAPTVQKWAVQKKPKNAYSGQEIAEKLGWAGGYIYPRIRKLIAAGKLERTGKFYFLK